MTEFIICGSAAAEAWPAIFCNCRCCQEAFARGGKEIRTRTTYHLGDTVHIDFGPDACTQMQRFRLPFDRLKHLLITHSHQDHWLPSELCYRRPGFSVVDEENILTVHGNARVREKLEAAVGDDFPFYRLRFEEVRPGRPIDLGDGMRAVPVPANHDRKEMCVFYLLQVGDRVLLQANDTGWFLDSAWEILRDYEIDIVVMDSTSGKIESREGHLGCRWVVALRDEMLAQGILKTEHRFIANHFSHNGGWLHTELEEYFAPHGIEVGYDGMRIPV
ncbi:MAG TPA: MBL fold metallo-hydrolase [Armatimonadota bacterium]|jgi:phosphoribosyl 1,2-cyclic phosphate phosphodiesterase|nr:hypothetical protein [Armatimonadota bacterium]HOJ20341.1 MBL fold metallo-hydrolase [Armatimonadota bacterium]HOM81115.1 MBL fold metallo-hydrolase [Armatimonadota bacterium]HPO71330.1 MBL fold metallo-hydrolase [Armatimonadota bacterium]HPT97018.1 MBL fold metallo-hydrolase [Armatimonadota bacterium]